MIARLLRSLRLVPSPIIGPDEAEDRAKRAADEAGMPWKGEVRVSDGIGGWTVRTNCRTTGRYVLVQISNQTGEVLSIKARGGPR